MNKKLAALAMACALVPAVAMASDKPPTSDKMVNDYNKYMVVYTSPTDRKSVV